MMSSVVCLMLLSMVSAYNLTCPHVSQWETRATAECNDIDSYVCLWGEVDDIYKEKCTGPKKAREGFKSVFNLGNYNKQPCWPSNFQPFIFTTIGNKECIYQKSLCNEEGQVYGDTGSPTGDRGCRCDYTRGYAFVMRNTDPCYCIPFKEDCSCYFKKCDEGNMLSPDYFCSKDINLQHNYTCPTLLQMTEHVNPSHLYVGNEDEYNDRFVWAGLSVLTAIIVFIVLMVVLIFFWKELDVFLDKYRKGYVITDTTTDIITYDYEDATIMYELSKSGLLVNWFRNGEKINQKHQNIYSYRGYQMENTDNFYKLVIRMVNKENAGSYHLEVEGKFSPINNLYVRRRIVTDTPNHMIKKQGESATIVYELYKSGIPVTWIKDREIINIDINDNYKIDNTGNIYSLTVLHVSEEYAGEYHLVYFGEESPITELKVTDTTTEIDKEEGQNVIISYECSKSGLPMYCFKDGALIVTADDTNFETEKSECCYKLRIKYLSCKNAGSYKIKAGNMYSPTSIVKVQPIFKSDVESVTCIEGKDATLQCEVMDDLMKATWFKDGEDVTNKGITEDIGTIRKLHITNTKLSDDGTYQIKVQEAKRQAMIKVKPYICKPLEDTIIMECLDTKLVCKAEEEGVKPKWYKDEKEIGMTNNILIEESEPGEYSLTIKETSLEHKGIYCVQLNGHISAAKLDVKALPEAIYRMSGTDRNNFITAAREGTAPRYYIRVMIVGKDSAGKTCLLRRLMGKDIEGVTSTDGINIEIKRCQIDIRTGEWSFSIDPEQYENSLLNQNTDKADCGFWDFAGQKEYYSTHQTFLTEDAIYLVVVRLKDIYDKKVTHTEEYQDFDNIGEYINFWLDNIHCYVGTIKKADDEKEYLDPPVIIVATGTDEIQKEDQQIKIDFDAYMNSHIGNQNKRNHIQQKHFVSNVKIEPRLFNGLKMAIYEIAKKSNKWGEHLPVRWILLEKQLLEMKSAGKHVIAYDDIASMGISDCKESDKLDSFLRYENEVGNIVYFDTLKTHIILDPNWLVNCFRCLVAHEQFQTDVDCTELRKTGRLSNDVIKRLFRKAPELKFLEHKDFLLQVMEKFDIIVKPVLHSTECDYYVPCMIMGTSFDDVVYRIHGFSRTSWFFVEFTFLPPVFFNHILVSHIRKYKLSVDVNNILALGHGFGILQIEESGRERLVLCAAKNCIALQLWYWNDVDRNNVLSSCVTMRKQLLGMINKLKMRYRIKVCYNFTLKCSEGNFNNPVGRISRNDMSKTKDYVCDEHNKLHLYSDIFNYWFEMERETADNEDSQRCNQICDLCEERSQYLCVTCNQSMCEDCSTNHQTWEQYSDHDIKQIGIEYKLSDSFPLQVSDIEDVKVLPDGLLVIADHRGFADYTDNQLITCTIKGEQYNRISLPKVPDIPCRITVVDNNTVAVLLYSDKILTVDIRHRQIINDIYVQGSECIMYSNNQLFVGCGDNTIKVVSLSGEVIRTIHLGFTPVYICGDDKKHIYISDYDNDKLHCTDNHLNSMFTFTSPDMRGPRGLTIDNEGYILVVCRGSNNVHRISPDGSHSQIIISDIPSSHRFPYICYDSVSQSVIIGRDETIYVYKQK